MAIRSLLPISLETMHDPKEPVLLVTLNHTPLIQTTLS